MSGPAAGRLARNGQRKWVEFEGLKFPTYHERDRWRDLRLLERAGLIWKLERQGPYPIIINGEPVYTAPPETKGRRPLTYYADFRYFDKDGLHVEDAKGALTDKYIIKKALVEAIYKIKITEV